MDFLTKLYLPSLIYAKILYISCIGDLTRDLKTDKTALKVNKTVLLVFSDIWHVRDIFKTQSNIYDGSFLRQCLTAESCQLFLQTSSIADIRLGLNTPLQVILTYPSPPHVHIRNRIQTVSFSCSFIVIRSREIV